MEKAGWKPAIQPAGGQRYEEEAGDTVEGNQSPSRAASAAL